MAKNKKKPDPDMQAPKEVQEELCNELMQNAPLFKAETWSQQKDLEREMEARNYGGHELRQLPVGMNKYNATNEFLILILESLYRIERKMGA